MKNARLTNSGDTLKRLFKLNRFPRKGIIGFKNLLSLLLRVGGDKHRTDRVRLKWNVNEYLHVGEIGRVFINVKYYPWISY
jgi:hypothetical protein